MDFFDFLTMMGGLALFLYGMHMLGEGLAKISGGKFEHVLESLTSNPLKAVFMGAGVTAVIQSSSAATVMVVGFVNSGIMGLQQAAGIIMGANVGTTITSWVLGAAGIDSDSFWVRMCKPASFSPILAIIGVGLMMFSKRDKLKNIAVVLIGFAVLMFGMDTMSGAVKPLADVPEFTGILTRFSNPFLGVLAGSILTAVIQSSSASVGILQALCATGALGYRAAIPIIMGQNIGTCVTAVLSGVGAGKNARRASLVHFYFNLIGTVLFMAVFYTMNQVQHFKFMDEAAIPFGIAAIHTAFNILSTIILLPFSQGLVKLACLSVPEDAAEAEKEENGRGNLLDVRFLEMPSYAVERSRKVAVEMAGLAQEAMELSIGLLENYTQDRARQVAELECRVDKYEDELGSFLVKLGSKELPERESRTLSLILHCISDFERISDHARNIMEAAKELEEKKLHFSDKAKEELEVSARAVSDILETAMESFREEDLQLAKRVEPLTEVINGLNHEVKRRHVKRLRKGKCTIEMGFLLNNVITNFERVAAHCSNIAVCLLQISKDELDTHKYVEGLKQKDNIEFRGRVMAYGERYQLP